MLRSAETFSFSIFWHSFRFIYKSSLGASTCAGERTYTYSCIDRRIKCAFQMPPCIMFSLHVAIAFFCFVFPRGKQINSLAETTDVWNPATCIKKPLPTWSEEDNNIQFTLQVCVLWHFQFSVRFIYLYVIIHKGLPPLWMCGISLWWIMFHIAVHDKYISGHLSLNARSSTIQDPLLMVLNSRVEVQWYATYVHPMSFATTFLCVLFSYNLINSLCTDNIFVSNYCFAFVFFVYFLNVL